MPTNFKLCIFLICALLIINVENNYSQVSITSLNTYYESFDGMGTSATATVPAGFRLNSTANWTTGVTATT
jgi:hypothetical protein